MRIEEDPDVEEYFDRLAETPLLTADEEIELAIRIRQGDEEAVEKLERANLRLVVSIAKKYIGGGLTFLDLIQEGNGSLEKAARKYDPDKINPKTNRPYRFSTYATNWIKSTIRRALMNQPTGATRIPINKIEEKNRLNKVYSKLLSSLGREPTTEEIAQKMGIDHEKVESLMEVDSRCTVPLVDDDVNCLRFLAAPNDDPEDGVDNRACVETLIEKAKLTHREEDIIRSRYGLNGAYGETVWLEDLGKRHKVTRERIRQIEAAVIKKHKIVAKGEAPPKRRDPKKYSHPTTEEVERFILENPVRTQKEVFTALGTHGHYLAKLFRGRPDLKQILKDRCDSDYTNNPWEIDSRECYTSEELIEMIGDDSRQQMWKEFFSDCKTAKGKYKGSSILEALGKQLGHVDRNERVISMKNLYEILGNSGSKGDIKRYFRRRGVSYFAGVARSDAFNYILSNFDAERTRMMDEIEKLARPLPLCA